MVVFLTGVVAQLGAPLSEWESRLHDELRAMPQRVAEGDLGSWDSRYCDVHSAGPAAEKDQPRSVVALLDQIFDFGRHNLYTQFDRERIRAEYVDLVDNINRTLNANLRTDQDVSIW